MGHYTQRVRPHRAGNNRHSTRDKIYQKVVQEVKMEKIILQRLHEDEFGLHGELLKPDNDPLCIYTLEPKDLGNQPNISCVPALDYDVIPHFSAHLIGKLWQLYNVPGRQGVLIHGGDVLKDTHGCILVGLIKNNQGVWRSQDALNYLATLVPSSGFKLRIRSIGDFNSEGF